MSGEIRILWARDLEHISLNMNCAARNSGIFSSKMKLLTVFRVIRAMGRHHWQCKRSQGATTSRPFCIFWSLLKLAVRNVNKTCNNWIRYQLKTGTLKISEENERDLLPTNHFS
jgi:hypothetical protein